MDSPARFRFERLDVWKKSLEFANTVYILTKQFPSEEKFGLTSQLRRAAVSIASNIAEGTSRTSDNEFARFIEISYGSLMECVAQLYISRDQGFIQDKDFEDMHERADELGRMLSVLRSRLRQQAISSGFQLSALDFPLLCN